MPRGLLLFAWVLLPIPAPAADKPADPPWKTNTPIVTVKKELHRKHSRRVLTALRVLLTVPKPRPLTVSR